MLALTASAGSICLLPMLAYTSLAILFSVATRNGILGVLGPLLVALVTQLLDLIGKGVIVHMLLIGSAFDGWHGLFAEPPASSARCSSRPGLRRPGSSAACAPAGGSCARRDFVANGRRRARPSWRTPIRGRRRPPQRSSPCSRSARPPRPDRRHRRPAERRDRPRVRPRHAAPAGADRPPRAARRQARRPPQLQPPRGRGGRARRLELHPVRLPAAGQRRCPSSRPRSSTTSACSTTAATRPSRRRPSSAGRRCATPRGRSVTNPLFIVYGCFNTL